MYDEKKVAEALKAIRKTQKMNQETFGTLVGVQKSAVSKWEKGRSQPTIENLWKLADHFGVTVDKLIGRE